MSMSECSSDFGASQHRATTVRPPSSLPRGLDNDVNVENARTVPGDSVEPRLAPADVVTRDHVEWVEPV